MEITLGQLEEIREIFRSALTDWDVTPNVKWNSDWEEAECSFVLWMTKFEAPVRVRKDGEFVIGREEGFNEVLCTESVWQWIASDLHERLPDSEKQERN